MNMEDMNSSAIFVFFLVARGEEPGNSKDINDFLHVGGMSNEGAEKEM